MKMHSMENVIKKVQSNLKWPTLERDSELPVIRIVSDIKSHSHLIFMPEKLHNKSSDLDYLHELGHATLCELVHPVFATNGQFAPLVNKKQFLPLLPSLSAASDWFVCHWQHKLIPEEMHKLIEENIPVVEEVLGMPDLPPVEIILDASLIIAQAVYYMDEPIECDGVLKNLVDAFLSVSPKHPSAENCVHLVNLLMATYTVQRARLIPDDGVSVWSIYHPPKADSATGSAVSSQAVAA